MNNSFMIIMYTGIWIVVLGMTLSVIASFLQYRGTGHKSTKALIGLITMVVLCLAAVIGLVFAQVHSVNLAKTGGLLLLLSDSIVIQVINQWTNPNMQKRIQRALRWMITGLAVVIGLIVIGFFIFVRS